MLKSWGGFFDNKEITIEQNSTGLVNNVYRVTIGSSKEKYILRESRRGTKKNHILLEVQVLEYLHKRGFGLTARIIKNDKEKYLVSHRNTFYTLQDYLPGKAVGSWDNLKRFDTKKAKSFFEASTLFSKEVKGFNTDLRIKNVELADYVNGMTKEFNKRIGPLRKTALGSVFTRHEDEIRLFIKQTQAEFLEKKFGSLPKQIVHFDLHPGNVHYIGDTVSGIFDFDWIRFDHRSVDIAATIAQSCYYYGGVKDGIYRKDRIRKGLEDYRKKYGRSGMKIKEENELIKTALKGYLLFQLIFNIDEYLANQSSPKLRYAMKHFLRLIVINDFELLFDC